MPLSIKRRLVGALVLGLAATSADVAWAQQLDPGISCIHGGVGPADYAELTSKYKESIWDSKAAVRLQSDNDALDLVVTDTFGTTVCEQTADSRTRCRFSFPATYTGIFNIRINNQQASRSGYKLCAE